MGMLHSSSGKNQFDPYFELTDYKISKEQLKAILIKEDALRASKEVRPPPPRLVFLELWILSGSIEFSIKINFLY